jgi:glycosyltransferase involved in cell wall biosynthesis
MKNCSSAEAIVQAAKKSWEDHSISHQLSHQPSVVRLDGVNVLIMASGHDATDPRIYKQASSLQRLGAKVTVVATLERGNPREVRVLTVRKPSSRLMRFLWQPWRCLRTAWCQCPDITHLHDAEMLIALPLAKLRWPRCRFVYDVREDFANLMLIRDWLPQWVKPTVRVLTNALEKGFAWFADGLVSVTPPLADKFNHRNKVVAYNFVAREFFNQADEVKREPRFREFDLVHLGTLNRRRAIFLVDTLRQFHRLRPRARSLVIGVSPEIEATISALVPDGCILLGRTPYQEIPALLGNAKVGLDVHPWLGLHLTVAMAVKVCEYMAAGCAVVASRMPVLTRILAEAGADGDSITIIEGGTPADYASAVARMVERIEGGADPGATLRESALQHMTWEEEAGKIAQLYLDLLGKPCAT